MAAVIGSPMSQPGKQDVPWKPIASCLYSASDFWRQWFMQCARMPPLEPVDTAGRLSWTNHIAQEELCHLARFVVSLAVHWHAKQIKAVSQKSQKTFRPKVTQTLQVDQATLWLDLVRYTQLLGMCFQHLSALQTAGTLPRALARAPHALQLPSPFPAVFLAPFPCKCSGK